MSARDRPLEIRIRELLCSAGQLPPEGDLERLRGALEALTDPAHRRRADPLLVEARRLERAEIELPSELGGVRRDRLLALDAISSTWEAWRPADGARIAVRLLRPHLTRDPVWLRRLERHAQVASGMEGLCPVEARLGDPHPHLRLDLGGPSLADLLPAEDAADPIDLARFLVGGLQGLRSLHAQDLVHGGLTPAHLRLTNDGVHLAWLDPVLDTPAAEMSEDLSALGRAVGALDPSGETELGELAWGWTSAPPPNAELAIGLLRRRLSSSLTESRHRLRMRERRLSLSRGEAHLSAAIRRLERALPPPTGTFCLRAGFDPTLVIVESDGRIVRGGPVGGLPARFTPRVYDPIQGLDPTATRPLLRAWATRRRGNEPRRMTVQRDLGVRDEETELLCRWLSAQARLRSLRLLLRLGGWGG